MSKHSKNTNNELPELSSGEQTRREIYDWIYCLSVALIICVVIFSFFIQTCNLGMMTGATDRTRVSFF